MSTQKTEVTSLLQLYGREVTIKMVLAATNKLKEKMKEADKDESLSPKGQLLKELCISFGPSGPKWASIISILIDEDIKIKDPNAKIPFISMAAVSPKESTGGHNYGINECSIMVLCNGAEDSPESMRCIRLDGSLGNSLPAIARLCEIPTDTKIIKAINNIFDSIGDIIIEW